MFENTIKILYLLTLVILFTLSGTKSSNANKNSDAVDIHSDQVEKRAQIMDVESSRSLWKTSSENKL